MLFLVDLCICQMTIKPSRAYQISFLQNQTWCAGCAHAYKINPSHIEFSSKMMRSVSFVDRLELEFSGNHFAHALTIGDVDSDGVRIMYWQ